MVPIYNARWRGKSAQHIYKDIKYLKENYGGNAIEFHDNNFFVSEKRTVEFSKLIKPENMVWWGEGRIDTIDKYSDESLALMRESGCKMIFFGAETGNDEILKKMDKGGTQTARRSGHLQPGWQSLISFLNILLYWAHPADTPEQVMKQIDRILHSSKKSKRSIPKQRSSFTYTARCLQKDQDMYNKVLESGFHFPEKLEDWISPQWENFDLRKNPLDTLANTGNDR